MLKPVQRTEVSYTKTVHQVFMLSVFIEDSSIKLSRCNCLIKAKYLCESRTFVQWNSNIFFNFKQITQFWLRSASISRFDSKLSSLLASAAILLWTQRWFPQYLYLSRSPYEWLKSFENSYIFCRFGNKLQRATN